MSPSPAESGVEDLHQQLVAGRHQLVVLDVRGGTVHDAVVFRQQRLDKSKWGGSFDVIHTEPTRSPRVPSLGVFTERANLLLVLLTWK